MKDKDLVFIVSGGRTGTQFFGDRLDTVIQKGYSVHEPDVFAGFNRRTLDRVRQFGLWHMLAGRTLGVTGLRTLGTKLLSGAISEEDCLRRLRNARLRFHQAIPERLIIESNAQWWYLVDQIPTLWPRAKVIVIIRDPRTWVRSWINKGGRYDNRDHVRVFPPGRMTPRKLKQAQWTERWGSMDTLGKLAWEWNTVYTRLSAYAINRREHSRIFRFEDLFGDDGSTMQQLVTFAASHNDRHYPVGNLEGFSRDVRNSSSGAAPDWRLWPATSAQLLQELCGPLMTNYGYGNEPEWEAVITGRTETRDA
jgi:hypothetical protein